MHTPHPHLHDYELDCLLTVDFWLQELRFMKIEPLALQKICRAMAMSCFVRTKGPSVLEVGYSIDYDMAGGIPEKDYECFEALAEAGMALHVKAFAGMSMVKLQHTPSFYLNTEGRDYVGSPSKSRWWAADYMLAAVGRLVGPVYEVRLGYYSSQYRAV